MSQTAQWQNDCRQLTQLFERERHQLLHSELSQLQELQQQKIQLLGRLQQAAPDVEAPMRAAVTAEFKRQQQRNRQLWLQTAQLVRGRLGVRGRPECPAGYGARGQMTVNSRPHTLLAGWV